MSLPLEGILTLIIVGLGLICLVLYVIRATIQRYRAHYTLFLLTQGAVDIYTLAKANKAPLKHQLQTMVELELKGLIKSFVAEGGIPAYQLTENGYFLAIRIGRRG